MSMYDDVNQFAAKRGAMYLGAATVGRLALRALESTLATAQGQIMQLAVPPFAVRLERASGQLTNVSDLQFELYGTDVFLSSTEKLLVEFSMGLVDGSGGWSATLTRFRLYITDLEFEISASPSELLCAAGNGKSQQDFQREADFDSTLATLGIDREEAVRVEGMLLYSGLLTAVSKPLSTPQRIDLVRLFPGVRFDGSIEIGVSSDQRFLFLTGSKGLIHEPGCECASVDDGIGPVQGGQAIGSPASDVENGSAAGTITIGGPTAVPVTGQLLGPRGRGKEDAGLFISNEMMKTVVEGPFPAFRVDLHDNGFIGWKAAAFVDFSDVRITPEPQVGRVLIDLDFRAEVYGSIHIDLGKFGKIRVTNFSAEQKGPGANTITVGLYAVIGTNGLYLKPVIEQVRFGSFDVFLRLGTLVGTPFGGWGAVIGYIFDVILGELIASQIPFRLEKEIRDYMAKLMVVLIDRGYSAEVTGLLQKYPPHLLRALYDGGPDGFLFSVGANG